MIRFRDLCFIVIVMALFILAAEWNRQHPNNYSQWFRLDLGGHLGAEYKEIAVALRDGRGFADPFRSPTGPTAWMPPAYPYFLAMLYDLTNNNEAVIAGTLLTLQALIVAMVGLTIIAQARELGRLWLGYVIFPLGIGTDYFELFQKTHDVWLALLLISLIWLGLLKFWHRVPSAKHMIVWGLLGGVAALSNPIIAISWAALTTYRLLPHPLRLLKERKPEAMAQAKKLSIAALVSILVITPWTIRNRVVMDAWIPIKSNAMYELWQSECLDDDGVLDGDTMYKHPWVSNNTQYELYASLGELTFNEHFGKLAKECIQQDPIDFLNRIKNRFVAALVYYQNAFAFDNIRPITTNIKRLVYPLPLLSLLIIFLWRRRPYEPALFAALGIYVIVLLPYVLVSFVDRYTAPLVGLKMIFMLFAADTLIAKFKKESNVRSHEP